MGRVEYVMSQQSLLGREGGVAAKLGKVTGRSRLSQATALSERLQLAGQRADAYNSRDGTTMQLSQI